MRSYLTVLFAPNVYATTLAGWEELEQFLNPGRFFDEVHIVNPAPDASPASVGTLRIHQLHRRWWQRLTKFPLSPVVTSLRCARLSRQLIARHGIPLVIQNEGNILDNGIPSVLAARAAGVPCLVTLLTDNRFSFRVTSPYLKWSVINGWLERWVLRRATYVRCVSPYLHRYALDRGVAPSRTFVAPLRAFTGKLLATIQDGKKLNGAWHDRMQGRTVLFSPVRFVPQKNIINMIRGFAIARKSKPDLLYCVLGNGRLRPDALAEVERLNLKDDVLMPEWVPFDELAGLFSVSAASLMVSVCEGTPRVLQQAFAAGLPIIGSTSGHFEGLIEEGVNGALADPQKPESIAEAILRVTADAGRLAKLKQGALASAPRFLDASVEQAEKSAYEKILSGKPF